jgi:hypothetical protein
MEHAWICPSVKLGGFTRTLRRVSTLKLAGPFCSICPSFLCADRVLVDLSTNRLIVGEPDQDLVKKSVWQQFNLERRPDGLYCDFPSALWPRMTHLNGVKLLRIGDLDADAMMRTVEKESPEAVRVLAHLDRLEWSGCSVIIKEHGGPQTIKLVGPDPALLKRQVQRNARGADLSGGDNPWVAVSAIGEFALQPGLNVIQPNYTLKNVPAAWVKPGPGGSKLVQVPFPGRGLSWRRSTRKADPRSHSATAACRELGHGD